VTSTAAGASTWSASAGRRLFIPQVPLALVGLALAALVVPEARVVGKVRFDVAGSVLLGLTVGSLLFAVNRAPTWGWSSPVVVACLLLSPLAGVARALPPPLRPAAAAT
jgi:hypothetical protein